MLSELVRTTTQDNLRLDGALFRPSVSPRLDLDACVLLHGVGSNFYGGNLFGWLTPEMLNLGIAVLRINTRGHDAVSWATTSTGASRQGSAYEIVDQCRHDVTAWVNLLVERGCRRIGLLGHSLGAIKAIYAQAHDPHEAVACVMAASPPRLSYTAFRNAPESSVFFEAVKTAEAHLAAGRAEALFQAQFPVPLLVAAESYLDKYGPEERYNILRFLDRLSCPLLVTYGERELESGNVAFAGMDQAIIAATASSQTVDIVTIAGADHFYTGVYDELGKDLVGWLTSQFSH